MKKILIIFGTRPEAIKMCPLILELKKEPNFNINVCVTGQHREMLDSVLNYFNIKPNYDLNIMKQKQDLFDITISILKNLKNVLIDFKPDLVLVHGDTTTSFAAALSCFYLKIPLGHVEAGLRTYDKYAPFPEEINRKFISTIADINFAPTEHSKRNLEREFVDLSKVFVTGNTVIDSFKYTLKNTKKSLFNEKKYFGKKIIFITCHRRENVGKNMNNIFEAIRYLALNNKNILFIYPLHKNPLIVEKANNILSGIPNIDLIEPLDVFECHNLISKSYIVLTDSGGLQEEAPYFKVPVLLLRDVTERPEGVEAGVVKIVGSKKKNIINEVSKLIRDKKYYNTMIKATNPFGDGTASIKIHKIIRSFFK